MIESPQQSVPLQSAAPIPDGVPMVDSLADIFGPQGMLRGDEAEVPDEVAAVLKEYGFGEKHYTCMLRQIAEGGAKPVFIKAYERHFPSLDFITNNFGPGSYEFHFKWQGKDPQSGKKGYQNAIVPFEISEKNRDQYEDFQFEKKMKRTKNKNDTIQNMRLDKELSNSLSGQPEKLDPKEMVKTYVAETVEAAKMLGLTQQKSSGFDLEKMMSMLLPVIPAVLGFMQNSAKERRERDDKFMTLMMTMSASSNQQLMEVMKNQMNGNPSGFMKTLQDTIMGAFDLKAALNDKEPEKESTADRIFGLIEAVAPKLIEVAALSAAQRQSAPAYVAAKTMAQFSPDLQQLGKDPELQAALFRKLDPKFGWEQTDKIAMVAELQRPASCPRLPTQRYPFGDPRNNSASPLTPELPPQPQPQQNEQQEVLDEQS